MSAPYDQEADPPDPREAANWEITDTFVEDSEPLICYETRGRVFYMEVIDIMIEVMPVDGHATDWQEMHLHEMVLN